MHNPALRNAAAASDNLQVIRKIAYRRSNVNFVSSPFLDRSMADALVIPAKPGLRIPGPILGSRMNSICASVLKKGGIPLWQEIEKARGAQDCALGSVVCTPSGVIESVTGGRTKFIFHAVLVPDGPAHEGQLVHLISSGVEKCLEMACGMHLPSVAIPILLNGQMNRSYLVKLIGEAIKSHIHKQGIVSVPTVNEILLFTQPISGKPRSNALGGLNNVFGRLSQP